MSYVLGKYSMTALHPQSKLLLRRSELSRAEGRVVNSGEERKQMRTLKLPLGVHLCTTATQSAVPRALDLMYLLRQWRESRVLELSA